MATQQHNSERSTTISAKAKAKTGSRSARKNNISAAKPADAIALLKADHREVKNWFTEYDKTDDDAKKQDLANKICKALTVHAQIEEEIFYPAAYDAIDDDDLLDEANVEHATAKDLIFQIESMRVGDPLFDAKITVLSEYINHHVEEEESEMFPECRDSEMDLKSLGKQMAERKTELMGLGFT